MRFWSPDSAPAGRMPGTTSTPSGPVSARSAATSCGEQTKPRIPPSAPSSPAVPPARPANARRRLPSIARRPCWSARLRPAVAADRLALPAPRAPRPASPALRRHERSSCARPCRCRAHRAGHRVGNVVKLQIEKHRMPARHQRLDYGRTGCGKQLHPHLEPLASAFQALRQISAAAWRWAHRALRSTACALRRSCSGSGVRCAEAKSWIQPFWDGHTSIILDRRLSDLPESCTALPPVRYDRRWDRDRT